MIVTILMNNASEFTFEVGNEDYDSKTMINDFNNSDPNGWVNFGNVLFKISNISTIKYEEETK